MTLTARAMAGRNSDPSGSPPSSRPRGGRAGSRSDCGACHIGRACCETWPGDRGPDPPVFPSIAGPIRILTTATESQAIAIDADYAARRPPVINARSAVGQGKEGLKRAICASVSQERIRTPPLDFSGGDLQTTTLINGSLPWRSFPDTRPVAAYARSGRLGIPSRLR